MVGRTSRPTWLGRWLVRLLIALSAMCGLALTSTASALAGADTYDSTSPLSTGVHGAAIRSALTGSHSFIPARVSSEISSSASVANAAEDVPETLSFGSRAAAREGLPGDLATVGNRFLRGATGKSQDFQAIGLPGGGYRLQFFSPAENPGYGKLYVQEIDRDGNIVSRYKDTFGPDGFIERKMVQ